MSLINRVAGQKATFAVCPACSMSGHDADSIRANKLESGVIACFNCESTISEMSYQDRRSLDVLTPAARMVVAALIRSRDDNAPGLSLGNVQVGGRERSDSESAIAVASLNVDALADNDAQARIVFRSVNPTAHLVIGYDTRKVGDYAYDRYRDLLRSGTVETSTVTQADQLEHMLLERLCPPDMAAAIGRLVVSGFAVQRMELGNLLRSVKLTFADSPDAPGAQASPTITVDCSFCV